MSHQDKNLSLLKMKLRLLTVFIIPLVLFSISCTGTEEPRDDFPLDLESLESADFGDGRFSGDELHPKSELVPHPDVPSEDPVVKPYGELPEDIPMPLASLGQFLQSQPPVSDDRELKFFASNNDSFHAASLNDSTLLFLDHHSNGLHHYYLHEDKSERLAPEGRGPGDLFFTREMQLQNNTAYIAMEGGRVSLFNCGTIPCEYEETVMTEFNHYSVTPSGQNLLVLGVPPYMGPDDPDAENTNQNVVHQLDASGEVLNSFSPVYKHKSPLVRIQFTMGSKIRSFEDHGLYAKTHRALPYLYLYNSDFELSSKYLLPDFMPGYYLHSDSGMGAGSALPKNSSIAHLEKLDEDRLFIQVRDQVPSDELGGNTGRTYRYFVFNVSDHTLYSIGEEAFDDADLSRSVYLTEYGLIVNEQGTLYWREL